MSPPHGAGPAALYGGGAWTENRGQPGIAPSGVSPVHVTEEHHEHARQISSDQQPFRITARIPRYHVRAGRGDRARHDPSGCYGLRRNSQTRGNPQARPCGWPHHRFHGSPDHPRQRAGHPLLGDLQQPGRAQRQERSGPRACRELGGRAGRQGVALQPAQGRRVPQRQVAGCGRRDLFAQPPSGPGHQVRFGRTDDKHHGHQEDEQTPGPRRARGRQRRSALHLLRVPLVHHPGRIQRLGQPGRHRPLSPDGL